MEVGRGEWKKEKGKGERGKGKGENGKCKMPRRDAKGGCKEGEVKTSKRAAKENICYFLAFAKANSRGKFCKSV